MKLPFVSRKKYDALLEQHGELCDRSDQLWEKHDREIRRLHEELYHARHAIFNTRAMKRYEEYLAEQHSLRSPAAVVGDLVATLDRAKAAADLTTGIAEFPNLEATKEPTQ